MPRRYDRRGPSSRRLLRIPSFANVPLRIAGFVVSALIVVVSCGRLDARNVGLSKNIDRVFLMSETSLAPSEARGRVVGLWFTDVGNDPVLGFAIDSRHVRVRLQCYRLCAARTSSVLRAADVGIVVSSDVTGRPTAFVRVPIPVAVPWGIYRVRLFDDGHVARLPDGERVGFPRDTYYVVSIPPPSDASGNDVHLTRLRKKYVGRVVQGFGTLTLTCNDAESLEPSEEVVVGNEPSLRVVSIERPLSPLRRWRVGIPMDRRYQQDWQFTVVSPLRVRFSPGRFGSRNCAHPQMWLSDEWEVERVLWIHAPVGEIYDFPNHGEFPIRAGMNKIRVAHLLGFPSEFGTVEDMLKRDVWDYAEPPPFDYGVRFQNGVVIRARPPGNLP